MDNTTYTATLQGNQHLDFYKRVKRVRPTKKELKAYKAELLKQGYTGSFLTKKD
jgi:hypothetical protein